MKQLIFIALMFGFLIGNAQQDRQRFSTSGPVDQDQIYSIINPGFSSAIDLYRNEIRKTDYQPGYPVFSDPNRYSIRKPDNHPGYPISTDPNRYSIRKTDSHPGYPVLTDPNRYSIKKTD
ncbi:MAG: hypothetical protein MUC31_02370 [Bacteroidales bacterium]|jgi:hypothetical protein|nr:hypothetical protein [Bacteroidales bacterium]